MSEFRSFLRWVFTGKMPKRPLPVFYDEFDPFDRPPLDVPDASDLQDIEQLERWLERGER